MIPEIDTQLAAVIKSLGDNVLPSVDTANPMAAEQIRLCLATLAIVRHRLPLLHAQLRRDLLDQLALARQLATLADLPAEIAERLRHSAAQAGAALGDAAQGPAQLEAAVRALKQELVEVIAATRGRAVQTRVRQIVLDAQAAPILRQRAWTVGMGFEPDPAQIPALEGLLSIVPAS